MAVLVAGFFLSAISSLPASWLPRIERLARSSFSQVALGARSSASSGLQPHGRHSAPTRKLAGPLSCVDAPRVNTHRPSYARSAHVNGHRSRMMRSAHHRRASRFACTLGVRHVSLVFNHTQSPRPMALSHTQSPRPMAPIRNPCVQWHPAIRGTLRCPMTLPCAAGAFSFCGG